MSLEATGHLLVTSKLAKNSMMSCVALYKNLVSIAPIAVEQKQFG